MEKNKSFRKKSFSLLVAAVFIFTNVFTIAGYATDTTTTSSSATRIKTIDSVIVGKTFDVNYTITPKSLPVFEDKTMKDVVLVFDTSTSMNEKYNGDKNTGNTRMHSAKKVATDFTHNLKFNKYVQIGIVEFYGYGSKVLDFTNAGIPSSTGKFTSAINQLKPRSDGAGTNIGDGLRIAYNMLETQSSNDKKYIIVLTDGESNFTSNTASICNGTNYYTGDYINPATEIFNYKQNGYKNTNYYFNIDSKYFASGTFTDEAGYSLNYAKKIASNYIAKDSNITTHIVGFGAEKLDNNAQIALAANGKYNKATDQEKLNALYNEFANEIISPKPNVYFEETIPEGMEYVSNNYPNNPGLNVSGNKITGKIAVSYELNDTKTEYIAKPVTFKITYKVHKEGKMVFTDNSGFVTLDIDNLDIPEEKVYFNKIDIFGKIFSTPTITIIPQDNDTNTSVTVKMENGSPDFTPQYNDGSGWTDYTEPFKVATPKNVLTREADKSDPTSYTYSTPISNYIPPVLVAKSPKSIKKGNSLEFTITVNSSLVNSNPVKKGCGYLTFNNGYYDKTAIEIKNSSCTKISNNQYQLKYIITAKKAGYNTTIPVKISDASSVNIPIKIQTISTKGIM